jgi:hypothetical protein
MNNIINELDFERPPAHRAVSDVFWYKDQEFIGSDVVHYKYNKHKRTDYGVAQLIDQNTIVTLKYPLIIGKLITFRRYVEVKSSESTSEQPTPEPSSEQPTPTDTKKDNMRVIAVEKAAKLIINLMIRQNDSTNANKPDYSENIDELTQRYGVSDKHLFDEICQHAKINTSYKTYGVAGMLLTRRLDLLAKTSTTWPIDDPNSNLFAVAIYKSSIDFIGKYPYNKYICDEFINHHKGHSQYATADTIEKIYQLSDSNARMYLLVGLVDYI